MTFLGDGAKCDEWCWSITKSTGAVIPIPASTASPMPHESPHASSHAEAHVLMPDPTD